MRTAIAGLAIASVLVIVSGTVVPATAFADQADPAASSTEGAAAGPSSDGALLPSEVRDARAQIDASLVQMRATAQRVRDQLRTARKRGTRRQIMCTDAALSQADVAVRRARETSDEVLAAYARGDRDAARAAQARLAEIKEAQRIAASEGMSCAPAVFTASAGSGVTTVRLEVDPRIAAAP